MVNLVTLEGVKPFKNNLEALAKYDKLKNARLPVMLCECDDKMLPSYITPVDYSHLLAVYRKFLCSKARLFGDNFGGQEIVKVSL